MTFIKKRLFSANKENGLNEEPTRRSVNEILEEPHYLKINAFRLGKDGEKLRAIQDAYAIDQNYIAVADGVTNALASGILAEALVGFSVKVKPSSLQELLDGLLTLQSEIGERFIRNEESPWFSVFQKLEELGIDPFGDEWDRGQAYQRYCETYPDEAIYMVLDAIDIFRGDDLDTNWPAATTLMTAHYDDSDADNPVIKYIGFGDTALHLIKDGQIVKTIEAIDESGRNIPSQLGLGTHFAKEPREDGRMEGELRANEYDAMILATDGISEAIKQATSDELEDILLKSSDDEEWYKSFVARAREAQRVVNDDATMVVAKLPKRGE